MSEANLKLVDDLCYGLEGGDMGRVMPLLAEDVYYHNMPWDPMTGAARVRDFLQPFLDGTNCRLARMEILHRAASGNVVLNARLERWIQGETVVELPVAGVFTIANGVVVRWEDYFDAATMRPLLGAT